DLTFEISGTNKYNDSPFTRRARLEDKDGKGVTFPTHQKTRIGGVMVPESIIWTIDDINVSVADFEVVKSSEMKEYFGITL
ncbi:MAG: hypothetical protein MJZ06_10145, partial [Bacteroidaceae bacterium]|nr:hypothetical protein [Bacteroidaceae bacterium]